MRIHYVGKGKEMNDFSVLLGKTITEINVEPDQIHFLASDGKRYMMYHEQDCCESVYVEDVVGDIEDLIGNPVLRAEESTNRNDPPSGNFCDDSYTWTYYKLATIKGYVDIRWFGTSNGYYSESVDFREVN